MIVRRAVELFADFPDDGILYRGDYVRAPGRNVAAAVADLLTRQEYVVSGPIYGGLHGWDLDLEFPGRREQFSVQIAQGFGDILIVIRDRTGLFAPRSWAASDLFPKFLKDLHAGLLADARFRDLRWFNFGKNGNGELDPGTEPVSET